jgi:acetyl-CoA carboxylase carboxyltransferase component
MGPCLGGQALSAQLADFIFMVQNTGYMSIGSDSGASLQEIGNAKIHSRFSGSCDVVCRDDEECLQKVRELISILPLNNNEKAPFVETGDDPEREVEELLDLVPTNSIKSYSMYQVISLIVDQGYFFEIKHYWATNLIVGFARLGGQTVGMLANNPQSKGGCMDVDSADKMAHFVRFCDAFNIPLIWLADTPAFLPGVDQETRGIIRHGSKVPFHNTMFSVPGLTVYLRKCYGGGNLAMPGNNMAGDIGIEWPTSEIFLMNPEGAAAIIHRKEIEASENPEEELSRRQLSSEKEVKP